MQPLPNQTSPLVKDNNSIAKPWDSYLQQFTQAPPSFVSVNLTGAIFRYTAAEPGFLFANGFSVISLFRGSVPLNFTGQKLIPVSIADVVFFDYVGTPELTFIPIYGNAPAL